MKIKFILFISFLIFSSNIVFGQANWTTDYESSLAKAKLEKKPVLLLFTGSDWCPPCQRLHKAIFDSKEFEEFSKDNLVLIKADFPKRRYNQISKEQKAHNNALAQKYGIRGFPTTLILDTNGKVLDKKVGYRGVSPEQYIGDIKKIAKTKLHI